MEIGATDSHVGRLDLQIHKVANIDLGAFTAGLNAPSPAPDHIGALALSRGGCRPYREIEELAWRVRRDLE